MKLFEHRHWRTSGIVEKESPMSEDSYRFFGLFYVIHCQNYKRDPGRSGPTHKHIWRLHFYRNSLVVIVKYGYAKRDDGTI